MLKTVSGKRVLGQCEVCRVLLSEPLYSSSFEFITLSLDLKQSREINPITETTNDSNVATNEILLDYYAKRYTY